MNDPSRAAEKQPVRLCLDVRMYRHSGIGVYIRQQVEQYRKNPAYHLILLVPERTLPEWEGLQQIYFPAPIYSLWEQLLYPFIVPRCAIFWSPHYNIPVLPLRVRERWVTIHDVYHLRFGHTIGWLQRQYAQTMLRIACKKSDRIFTVSQFSRKEILHFCNAGEKIEVIRNSVDTEKFSRSFPADAIKAVLKKYHLQLPYLLFVGNLKPNKNLLTLLKAFELLQNRIGDMQLVIVGKAEGFRTADNAAMQFVNARPELKANLVFTGPAEDDELPILYQQARLFIFPSIYEGFGYPPLEALAAGTTVLCSNAGPMPEVCGERVHYFDPKNAEQLSILIAEQLEIS
jgi:glycosyltransferase involved in cell wall biosynthesis